MAVLQDRAVTKGERALTRCACPRDLVSEGKGPRASTATRQSSAHMSRYMKLPGSRCSHSLGRFCDCHGLPRGQSDVHIQYSHLPHPSEIRALGNIAEFFSARSGVRTLTLHVRILQTLVRSDVCANLWTYFEHILGSLNSTRTSTQDLTLEQRSEMSSLACYRDTSVSMWTTHQLTSEDVTNT